MARPARPDPIKVSEELERRIDAEPGGLESVERMLRQYEAMGFTELRLDATGAELLLVSPRYRATIGLPGSGAGPVRAALDKGIEVTRAVDLYTRLRMAAADMATVEAAAKALAPYQPGEDGKAAKSDNPCPDLDRVAVAGIVTIYSRPFTGRARLADKWAPTDSDELALHKGLLTARDHIYAHADHTAYRALFDPAGEEGSEAGKQPSVIEMAIVAEVLPKIAVMCATQRKRFEAEAERLWSEFASVLVASGSLSSTFDSAPDS